MDGYMTEDRIKELTALANNRLEIAIQHIENSKNKNILFKGASKKESEVPGFEGRPLKFAQFENKEFVAVMTDIRRSSAIINEENGTEIMFQIFYVYSAVVASIIDSYGGTATEFLGDGVLNLFDVDTVSRQKALANAMLASKEILEARNTILNPLFKIKGLPEIDLGIGIDYGMTIVTRFGYKTDNDLKAFGKCVYHVSRLCKGENEIHCSHEAQENWPKFPGGTLRLDPKYNSEEGFIYHHAYNE